MYRRLAILADIHGNLAALQAVLADASAAGVDELVVAGDLVNRGPESAAVVDLLLARGAALLRGNHEAQYVAVYGTPAMPVAWTTGWGTAVFRRTMESLGPLCRNLLAALPDTLQLDDATVVAHGSPRHCRDEVRARTPAADLEAMLDGTATRLAFVAHTHQPVCRTLGGTASRPPCRFVNVGAVGNPLDGDPRACYALVETAPSGVPGDWRVTLRRVAYDIEATIAAFDVDLRQLDPDYVELAVRELRTGRAYLGPARRSLRGLPAEAIPEAIGRFLDVNP